MNPTEHRHKKQDTSHATRPRRVGNMHQRRNRFARKDNHAHATHRPRPTQTTDASSSKKSEVQIPPLGENIRIIPLGGVEEIGMNMTVIEIGDDILVIDAGFKFKDEGTPGIDYILPNTKYLEERKHKIRGIVITHGHLDHIGGLPFIIDRIGNPPIYTRYLTSLMLKKRHAEFPHLPETDYKIVEGDEKLRIGNMTVQFYGVTHSIPDAMGVAIETPHGLIVNPGDFKLNHTEGVPTPEEEKQYNIFKDKNVLVFLGESTNIENVGFSTPEELVHDNLEEIIKNIKGRLILGMFASHVLRIAKVIEACEKYNKKIVVEGRSMKNNIDILVQANLLKMRKDTMIQPQDIDNYPPDRVVVLATGAQGEEFAALMRMGNKTYKHFKINERDTVLLSASIVPGNEKAVEKLKDNLARLGAKIIHYRTSDVYIHSTGHAYRGEIEWLHKKLKPKFFIPIHGNHYRIKIHADVAVGLGMPANHVIVPDDGTIIEIQDKGEKIVKLPVKAPDNTVMVDGFTIGDIQEVVLRDRQMLAQDGMFVIIATVNISTGKLKKSPDIISRGFVYLRESQDLLRQTRHIIKKTTEDLTAGMHPINFDYIKDVLTDQVSKYLFQQTAKRPIVIPVLLGV